MDLRASSRLAKKPRLNYNTMEPSNSLNDDHVVKRPRLEQELVLNAHVDAVAEPIPDAEPDVEPEPLELLSPPAKYYPAVIALDIIMILVVAFIILDFNLFKNNILSYVIPTGYTLYSY